MGQLNCYQRLQRFRSKKWEKRNTLRMSKKSERDDGRNAIFRHPTPIVVMSDIALH
jgi:hypothetical protein